MKNSSKQFLLLIATIFVAFIVGVFVGRINNPYTPLSSSNTAQNNKHTNDTKNTTETQHAEGKININVATAEELMLLPGIGTELSERIIAYRLENGPFESIEELVNVKGIGNSNFGIIKDYLTVGE